jgi:hypothetical protein
MNLLIQRDKKGGHSKLHPREMDDMENEAKQKSLPKDQLA